MLPASFLTNRFLMLTCLIVSSLGFYQILSASFEELTVLDMSSFNFFSRVQYSS